MILCAGLGTRLKPWTLHHPKALVPVGGVPMLKRVVDSLSAQGFDELVINVHHFADRIIDYVKFDLSDFNILISDESNRLLDTGGGILNAGHLLSANPSPFLVHNVDILSNADLAGLYRRHIESRADVSLLVSDRDSSRRLVFDSRTMRLKGWVNTISGQTRPEGFSSSEDDVMLAFSGIYVMSVSVFAKMRKCGLSDAFPIMDFFIDPSNDADIRGIIQPDLEIIDIGKPETLQKANLQLSLE